VAPSPSVPSLDSESMFEGKRRITFAGVVRIDNEHEDEHEHDGENMRFVGAIGWIGMLTRRTPNAERSYFPAG
jgi:hypothetical protein